MTVDEETRILDAAFDVIDHVDTLHLTGGGEPFLHPKLVDLIEAAMKYSDRFDRLMLFTNCTMIPSEKLIETLTHYREKILVQISQYGLNVERERLITESFQNKSIPCKVVKYYGENQDFGGWVDFGPWEAQNKGEAELKNRFQNCAVTKAMHGNWRTRDGKVHWCSRSQRGMELGLIPDCPDDYVDLFGGSTKEEKQEKFSRIAQAGHLSACDRCSGEQGTDDESKRFTAAVQMQPVERG